MKGRSLIIYALLLGGVGIAYLIIRFFGDTLAAPAPIVAAGGNPVSLVHVNDFVHVLLALVLVIGTARTLGALFRVVHQPPVVGEMIAGILLGPSLLGRVAPDLSAAIFPHSVVPLINVISQVGVILYMFLVGLELDVSSLRDRAQATVTISHASIVVPFLLGAGLALVLYPQLSTSDVSFTAFSMFLGVSMSVTAFPVLARILTDRGIHKTQLGSLTLTCAAIDDVSAWCLLAFVVSVTQSRAGRALTTVLLAGCFIAAMIFLIRPLVVRMTRLLDDKGRLTQGSLAVVLLAILLSSLATESIGIHSIFGAFALGAIIPHGSSLARDLTAKLEDFVIVFLLPAFFAFTGLRTQIGLVRSGREWFFCGLIIVVASLGKFGGSAVAARLSGIGWRNASALGVLMNTRGLMELIVLNIGLELHVISPTLFAMLVLMALATTFATTPILHFITPRKLFEEEAHAIEAASKIAAAASERAGTLIPVSNPNGMGPLLDIALSLTPPDGPPPRVLALVRASVTALRSGFTPAKELPPSRSSLLSTALDLAWSRGAIITPRAVWTTDPAADIVQAAEAAQVKWLVLESRRSILGRFPKRSVVSKLLDRVVRLPINVAVLLQSEVPVSSPICCLLDSAKDGSSALELASQLARGSRESLRVLVLEPADRAQGATSEERDWHKTLVNHWHTSFLSADTAQELLALIPEGVVVAGKDVVDRFQIAFDEFTKKRSVVLVQGAGRLTPDVLLDPLTLQPVTA